MRKKVFIILSLFIVVTLLVGLLTVVVSKIEAENAHPKSGMIVLDDGNDVENKLEKEKEEEKEDVEKQPMVIEKENDESNKEGENTNEKENLGKDKEEDSEVQVKEDIVHATCYLNVRKDASTNNKRIGLLQPGEELKRIEKCDNGWSKVIYKDSEAYCYSKYLAENESEEKSEEQAEMVYTTCALNIRRGPGMQYKILGVFQKGATVKRTEVGNDGWSKIIYKGSAAYCFGKYLTSDTVNVDEKENEKETDSSDVIYTDRNETVYATTTLNIRKGPGTSYVIIGVLAYGKSITRTAKGNNGWSKVSYNGQTAYCYNKYLSTEKPAKKESTSNNNTASYPLTYSDNTSSIVINKKWYGGESKGAWCYIAHLKFTDYGRFGTACSNGKYNNGYETVSHAASRLGVRFCVNGCYSAPYLNYPVVRSGILCNDGKCNTPGIYNTGTGVFNSPEAAGISGEVLSELVRTGKVTDTFCFGPSFLVNGSIVKVSDTSRAQRTFIGSNGKPGDIWVVVSDGRNVDGKSAGLTYNECAQLLKDCGCTFGIPLDGGGSSTMVFDGKVLNHVDSQRAVVDFIYLQ